MSQELSNLKVNTIPSKGVLTISERNEILKSFNDTSWHYAEHETLISLFNKQVTANPDQLALQFQNWGLSYKELDEKSNQVANYLISRGLKSHMFICVWLDRSLEWIVAVLGILKTGAAYIPVDPLCPIEKAEAIITDAGARLVITNTALGKNLVEDDLTEIFYLDNLGVVITQPVTSPDILITKDALAYIMYTEEPVVCISALADYFSSENRPERIPSGNLKGVMITHQSIQHLASWHNQEFKVTANSRLALVAGPACQTAVWEVWTALVAGAAIYIANKEEKKDAVSIADYFQTNEITHGFAPSEIIPEIVTHTKTQTSLKYLFTGAEDLKTVSTDSLPYKLITCYGPAEFSSYAAYHEVKEVNGKFIPSIGKPIANTKVYILDEQQQILPLGAKGELCISGEGLANGYLNQKELTDRKFIAHPFEPGTKLFLTGITARWRPDGTLQLLDK